MRVLHAGYHEGSVGDFGNALHWYVYEDELAHNGLQLRQRRDGLRVGRLMDTRLLGGYRKCSGNSMGAEYHWRPMYRNVVCAPEDPNGPPLWDGTGTQWAMRAYGVCGGRFEDYVVRSLYGAGSSRETAQEGHGNYLTLAPIAGQRLVYKNAVFADLGGHGIYHTTAWDSEDAANPDRAGNAPEPWLGGVVAIRRCLLHNTDGSPARGSYSINLVDAFSRHVIRNTRIVQDWREVGGVQDADGGMVNSRGLLSAKGCQESLEIINPDWLGVPPVDRTASVSIRGPRAVTIRGGVIDCPVISINHHGSKGTWRPGQPLTERVLIDGLRGTGRLELYEVGSDTAMVYQLSMDEPLTVEVRLGVSEFWAGA